MAGEKSPVASVYTAWVKIFVKIDLFRTVFQINALLRVTQKFKMATKRGGKVIFEKSCQ